MNSHSPVQEGNESKVFCTDPSGQMRIVAPVATFLLEYLWEAEQKGEEWGGGVKGQGKMGTHSRCLMDIVNKEQLAWRHAFPLLITTGPQGRHAVSKDRSLPSS